MTLQGLATGESRTRAGRGIKATAGKSSKRRPSRNCCRSNRGSGNRLSRTVAQAPARMGVQLTRRERAARNRVRVSKFDVANAHSTTKGIFQCLKWSPKLRQVVKAQNPLNGRIEHGVVTPTVHERVQVGRRAAAGSRGLDCGGVTRVGSKPERVAALEERVPRGHR